MTTQHSKEIDSDSVADAGQPLAKVLTFRLSRLHARANAHAARLLEKHADISLSEWRIFVMIETHGKISPAQIVRMTKFDKGLVSRTIKGMKNKGLVSVTNSETDHRSHFIDFTPFGRTVFETARPAMRTRREKFSQSLEPRELETLFLLFDKLDSTLDEMEEQL